MGIIIPNFFHTCTIIYRQKNKTKSLKQAEGSWCFEQDSLKSMAVEFFAKVYTNDSITEPSWMNTGGFPRVDHMDYALLVKPYSCKEIHLALSQMKSFKALGPDEFQAKFK